MTLFPGNQLPIEVPPSRRRDAIWDTVVAIWHPSLIGVVKLGLKMARAVGAESQALRDVGATPDEIRKRWPRCQERYPGATTSYCLAKHWDEFAKPTGTEMAAINRAKAERRQEEERAERGRQHQESLAYAARVAAWIGDQTPSDLDAWTNEAIRLAPNRFACEMLRERGPYLRGTLYKLHGPGTES